MKPACWPAEIPYIDPDIQHVGVSGLRAMNSRALRDLQKLTLIKDAGVPLVVVVPYAMYLELQHALLSAKLTRAAAVEPPGEDGEPQDITA